MNILVIGIGLIGGSLIKSFKKSGIENVSGIDISKEIVSKCVREKLIINSEAGEIEVLKEADLVFLCLYPEAAIDFLTDHMDKFKSGVIITDVIGLKSKVLRQVNKIKREDITFIGGHPMAGKEGKGFDESNALIFEAATYLLVVDNDVNDKDLQVLIDLIYKIGCSNVEILKSEEHDAIMTYTSHMPHILASTLMSLNEHSKTKNCIAGSFKDFTRVADINADLWTELIVENRALLLDEIDKFKNRLSMMESYIYNNDRSGIKRFLNDAKTKKQAL